MTQEGRPCEINRGSGDMKSLHLDDHMKNHEQVCHLSCGVCCGLIQLNLQKEKKCKTSVNSVCSV